MLESSSALPLLVALSGGPIGRTFGVALGKAVLEGPAAGPAFAAGTLLGEPASSAFGGVESKGGEVEL